MWFAIKILLMLFLINVFYLLLRSNHIINMLHSVSFIVLSSNGLNSLTCIDLILDKGSLGFVFMEFISKYLHDSRYLFCGL